MILENQTCSLELAKKLKELQVEQNSLFYWLEVIDNNTNIPKIVYSEYNSHEDREGIYSNNLEKWKEIYYSAYTVGELGSMMPKWLFGPELLEWKSEKQEGGIWAINVYRTHMTCEPDNLFWANEEKQADAYAKMLIYIKENKLI